MRRVTVVAKATLTLVPDAVAVLATPAPLALVDRLSPDGTLREPKDLVPYARTPGVVLTGHAHASGGQPVTSMAVRLAIYRDRALVDRTIHVFGDANGTRPFEAMPLTWERAYGGAGVAANPVGRGATPTQSRPNLVDPADPRRPACFAPIASTWAARAARLTEADWRGLDQAEPELGPRFDAGFFDVAPPTQSLPAIAGDEWIVLDGMSASHARLQSRLPSISAQARCHAKTSSGGFGGPLAIDLRAELLAIDADAASCTIVWRGSFALAPSDAPEHLHVVAGLAIGAEGVAWPDPAALTAPLRRTSTAPPGAPNAAPPRGSKTVTSTLSLAELQGSAPQPIAPFAIAAAGSRSSPQAPAIPGAPWSRNDAAPFPNAGPMAPTRIDADDDEQEPTTLVPNRPVTAPPLAPDALPMAAAAGLPPWIAPRVPNVDEPLADATLADRGDAPVDRAPPVDDASAATSPLFVLGSAPLGAPPAIAAPTPIPPPLAATVDPPAPVAPPPMVLAAVAELDPTPRPEPARVAPPKAIEAIASPLEPEDEALTTVASREDAEPTRVAPPVAVEAALAEEPRAPAHPADSGPSAALRATIVAKLRAGEALRGTPLAGADLRGLDFSGAFLAGLDFSGARLENARFQRARLADASFAGADLTEVCFDEAELSRADLTRAVAPRASFERASLVEAKLGYVNAAGARFVEANAARAMFARGTWDGACFDGARLESADFTGASMSDASLRAASLVQAVLDDARATGACFDEASLADVRARGASIASSSLRQVDASRSIWESAALSGSSFEGATLVGATLERARADRTSFARASARGVSMQRLEAEGACFDGADLEGADLRQARARDASFTETRARGLQAARADLGGSRFVGADLGGALLRAARLDRAVLSRARLDGADLRDAILEGADLRGAERATAKLGGANVRGAKLEGDPEE